LQTILEQGERKVLYHPLPVYPSSGRDVSLLVERNVNFAEIEQAIETENFELLRKIEFVDLYEGKGIADEERSITIRFEYRSDEKTLLDEEVDSVHSEILKILEDKFKAKLR
jgi:phenylalanyl-tRNA synthetase beta chain